MVDKRHMSTHEGNLSIGENNFPVAVLDDGTRLLTRTGILEILGRPYKGQYKAELPAFIQGKNLTPFISDELRSLLVPIRFKSLAGKDAIGFKADVLPEVCSVYLSAQKSRALTPNQEFVAEKCGVILKALAKIGIVALIDEATGYQESRDRKALQALLDKFLLKEYAAWAKRFPDVFYKEIFRLKSWQWVGMTENRPYQVGHITNDVVYRRLAPGILKELQERNPKTEGGNRKSKHHQWLTMDIGHVALAQHLHAVIALMRISPTWSSFYSKLQTAFPRKGDQFSFDFPDDHSRDEKDTPQTD